MPLVPLRDGRSLHVRVVGRGSDVLLLPGLGMNSLHWLPFIAPYLGRHRFVLPDFRGFGGSSHLRVERRDVFESHALDVRDVVAHFGLRDYALGGISLGCTTALHMLHDGGLDGVRKYLHIDQSPCVGNREDWEHGLFGTRQASTFAILREADGLLREHPRAKHLRDIPNPDRERIATTLAHIAATLGSAPERAPVLAKLLTLPRALSRHAPLSHLDDVRTYLGAYLAGGHDYRPALANLRAPTTWMVGMRSPLYPAEGQIACAARIPNARVVRFERSGHVPLTDEPRRFVRELGRFLAD